MKKRGRVQGREWNRPLTHADSWTPGSTEQSTAERGQWEIAWEL